ncbi:hypothetical protein SPSIL_005690 [Sporomusa silvacetica DSM 10669]|uniref:Flavinylation-associated cytochrome domain-containing protein n=1 Tax=Sporomusa silvacetica DSM 10669 TaxID=1123289 RepID=A0ABZ3IG47_9FIRM|nr:DUF4405 domain-containing protein [Sporomusa silvacetica]OZC17106.1 hypothetical protein SPSIL_34710 [Sporomusa silvacetica DSM 10669]
MKRNLLNTVIALLGLVLMNYRFTGNLPHELLGSVFLILVLWHNGLNRRWYTTWFKGKQNSRGILLNVINIFFVAAMLVTIISGFLISQSIFPYVTLRGANAIFVHGLHQGAAYASFILMGIHLGMHWETLWIRLKRWLGSEKSKKSIRIAGNIFAACVVLYGIDASFANRVGSNLMMEHMPKMRGQASVLRFFTDFLAIFGCYTAITHYVLSLLKKVTKE